jgi:hypothetical protein
VDSARLRRTELESRSTGHVLIENPNTMSIKVHIRLRAVCALLTGIPQFVLIPAPVTTTTFLDFAIISAISCSSRPEPDPTWIVGMASDMRVYGLISLPRFPLK